MMSRSGNVGRHSRCDQRHDKSSTWQGLRHSTTEGASQFLRPPYIAPKLLHPQVKAPLRRTKRLHKAPALFKEVGTTHFFGRSSTDPRNIRRLVRMRPVKSS